MIGLRHLVFGMIAGAMLPDHPYIFATMILAYLLLVFVEN